MYRLYKDPSGTANLDFSDIANNLSKDSKKKQATRECTISEEVYICYNNNIIIYLIFL